MTALATWLTRHSLPTGRTDKAGGLEYRTDAGSLLLWSGASGQICADFYPHPDTGDVEWKVFPPAECPEDVRAFIVGAS